MARTWSSYDDAEDAARAVVQCIKQNGHVPPVLVGAYRETLSRSLRGPVQRFYEALAMDCPEALRLFSDVERAGGDISETNTAR